MTVAVNDLIDKAEIILQDTTNVRWTAVELIGWLNNGQNEIVLYKPDASVTNAAVVCIEGTKQTIPAATGIRLIDVVRNMGTNGTTPGNAVRLISREILDAQVPGWHSVTGSATAQHYIFDDRDPKNFYVYPPQPSSSFGYLELVYSSSPTAAAADGNIALDDVYQSVLLDYILYRAYQKDADYASNDARSKGYYQAFLQALGIMDKVEQVNDPNNKQ